MKGIFVFIAVVVTHIATAQIQPANRSNAIVTTDSTEEKNGLLKRAFNRIKLIETFDQQFKSSEPAFYSAINPDTGKTTYQVQAAIGFALIDRSKFALSALYEWHQNTVLDKPQNVRQYGISADLILGSGSTSLWNVRGNIKWSNDLKDKKESYILTALVSPYINWEGKGLLEWIALGDHPVALTHPKFVHWLQYGHNVTVGIDHVNFYDANKEEEQGSITMAHLEYEFHLYPFAGLIYELLKFERMLDVYYVGITRRELQNETSRKVDWRPLQKYGAGLSFKFGEDKKREAKIVVERIYGEDVLKGLQDQKYWQVGLKVKL